MRTLKNKRQIVGGTPGHMQSTTKAQSKQKCKSLTKPI